MADILMPKFGLTMTEGLIAAWHRKPGEKFAKGDLLFEVETEKVTNEVEATEDGTLEAVLHEAGTVVPVGEPIGRALYSGEPVSGPAPEPTSAPSSGSGGSAGERGDAPSARKLMTENGIDPALIEGTGKNGRVMKHDVLRVIATPLARRIAKDADVDLGTIAGSGPKGRIKAADVEAAKADRDESVQKLSTARAPTPAHSSQPVQPDAVRAATARRVQAAKRDIPHFYVTRHANVEQLNELRTALNAGGDRGKISVTHLLVKAIGLALARHPTMNSVWLPEGILALDSASVGVVTETPSGLRIPVVADADALAIDELAAVSGELFQRARSGGLQSADMSPAAISISNVGMLGADSLTPIISPPQAMIIGVGAEQATFRPDDDGNPRLSREIILTLAADHRLIDGADAARFLATVVQTLEAPLELLRAPAPNQDSKRKSQ